jgi:cytoskeletal protein CcmA (bactofilin family)
MFRNKEKNYEKIKNAETIIGNDIKVKGNFQGKGNIIIEGTLDGSVKTNSDLFVTEKAKVSANITAKNAFIDGFINGGVNVTNCLFIGKTAEITGDIVCEELSIKKGAIINGNCTMKKIRTENIIKNKEKIEKIEKNS